MSRVMSIPHVISSHQLADGFTKSLVRISYDAICSKLGMFDIYSLASGGVSSSDIGLQAHLGHLIFILNIRTYLFSFVYASIGFLVLNIKNLY